MVDNLDWTFDEENREWIDQNGVRYSKDTNTLKKCPIDFQGTFRVPKFVTNIGDWAFYRCSSLGEIIIPESVTSIGDAAFSGCTSLWKLSIPESVTSIGDGAFYGCLSLREISIPKSVISIGNGAFAKCSILGEITIPESVISIGEKAFLECSKLRKISIPKSVTNIGDRTFYGCYSLRNIEICKSVSTIGKEAFWGCPIKTVILPPTTKYQLRSFDEVTKVIKAKVTISYSWDNEEHKAWVRKLAVDLHKNGVDVILDQWELKVGQIIPNFMEKSIIEAERVICIMTPNYKKKSDKLEGGVGYEYSLIRGELFKNITDNKILPILRGNSIEESCPTLLSDRLYLDFRRDDSYDNSLKLLLRDIYKEESYNQIRIPKL